MFHKRKKKRDADLVYLCFTGSRKVINISFQTRSIMLIGNRSDAVQVSVSDIVRNNH